MNKIVKEYLETALWSSSEDDDTPLDERYTIDDISQESITQAENEVNAFIEKAKRYFRSDDINPSYGHDFWLTRNHHGAGFWDGDYINGDKLTEIAQSFNEKYAYVGDDNKVYID